MELNEEFALALKPFDPAIVQDELHNCLRDDSILAMCRICLEKSELNKMCNIFDPIKPVHIYNMIMSCASVQVMEGDGLPNLICHRCMTKLSIAWEFKMQCENSDAKLRQLCSQPQHMQITPDLDSFNIALRQEQSHYSTKTELLYNQSLSLSGLAVVNNKIESNEMELGKKCKGSKNFTLKSKISQNTKTKEVKVHQCDTCGKTFHRREYLTQHMRIHTGEKPYRCHLCDKRFVNSGHLTTHMRTHTGERPHACNLCPKAFSTKQELQKHIMVHKGERPFICKMCDKRFGSSSNLYSHLKHHTGEKNFTCEHCGKAFYTKQELKQHLVVHTGERAFLCEYCNKRFAQIAHLRRHSKIHKLDSMLSGGCRG